MKKNEIVKNYILQKIENQSYAQGQIIESENTLTTKLQISRMTIRKGIEDLVQNGILFKEKGRGTFVAIKPKYSEFQCGVAFSDEVKKLGKTPSTIGAQLELVEASIELANELRIQVKDKLWKVTRIRCADDVPVVYAQEFFIYSQFPDLTIDTVNESIYKALENKGIIFAYADQKLEAVSSDTTISDALKLKKNTPLIKMTLTSYTQNGVIFNHSVEYFRTDQFTLIQTIYRK